VGCFLQATWGSFLQVCEWWGAEADQGVNGLWVWLADDCSCCGGCG
jgi:hypothetical protein